MGIHVTALGDGAAGRVSLGNEDTGFGFLILAFTVTQVVTAVAQLAVVQVGFLGAFACQLGDAGNGFALFLGVLYLLQHHFGHKRVLVEVIVHFRLDEVSYVFVYCGAGGLVLLRRGRPHVVAAQFRFGLAFEHGFFHVDGDGGYQSVAYVGILLVLVVEFLDGTGNVFL